MNCLECALSKSKKGKEILGKEVPAKEGSNFCEACQPVAGEANVIRNGYYVASHDMTYGDAEFSNEAREIFDSLGFTKDPKEGYKFAARFDSVSVFQKRDGSITKRICLHNFFSVECKVAVKDVT